VISPASACADIESICSMRAAAGTKKIFIVAENEPQDTRFVRPRVADGYGLDALWNDDLHHSARVALTGRAEAYYSDYRGSAQELVSAAKFGPLFQGQRYAWQKQPRGTRADGLPARAFVTKFRAEFEQHAALGRCPFRPVAEPPRRHAHA